MSDTCEELKPARNSGEQWHRDNDYKWMTADQWECFEMLSDLCRGAHHIGGVVRPSSDRGILINIRSGFSAATFDFSGLTEAVIMAHDRCIRFEIAPSGPGMLKLFLHKRYTREGSMAARHPTLEQSIKNLRKEVAP